MRRKMNFDKHQKLKHKSELIFKQLSMSRERGVKRRFE